MRVTPDPYKILGVSPDADDAAVRAAYRALMRLYHPDRNADPQAQLRAREVTAAFAVLGDPGKRTAYDASRFFDNRLTEEQHWPARRSPPPMRRVGLASIAIALAMTLAFAMRPQWPEGASQRVRTVVETSNSKPAAARLSTVPPSKVVAQQVAEVAETPAAVQHVAAPMPERLAIPEQPDTAPLPLPARHLAQPRLAQAPSPVSLPAEAVSTPPKAATPASCPEGSSRGPDGACSNDRVEQVERIATGFLKQSLEHADWHKQQLLLSAGNRSATARTMCHSDECVAGAYLRQIRDITTIMQGRIPAP